MWTVEKIFRRLTAHRQLPRPGTALEDHSKNAKTISALDTVKELA